MKEPPQVKIKSLLKIEESVPYEEPDRVTWKLPDGRFHRKNGPAVFHPLSGRKEWWVHGVLHREDGPAIEFRMKFSNRIEYWINGKQISKKEFSHRQLNKQK